MPDRVLPPPVVNGLMVHAIGAVESANSGPLSQATPSQTFEVDVMSQNTTLPALSVVVANPGQGVWNGVLVPYSVSFVLFTDSSGDVYGPQGNSGKAHPQVYQYLRESSGVPNGQSLPIGM